MKKVILVFVAALTVTFASAQHKLTIVHVNDTHSHIDPLRGGEKGGRGGVIERAAMIDSIRRADGPKNVLLLHAGDFDQGTSYFTVLHGDLEISLMNALQYDCTSLGNHEFDNGLEELARRLASLECPVVCANYDFSPFEVGQYIKPYEIVERAGMKIGIIGLLTDITTVVARNIADRIPKIEPVGAVNKWASYLKNEEGCDMVIALTHIGYDNEIPVSDVSLVPQIRNVDLVVGGHSHTFLKDITYVKDLDGKEVPIVQDGNWGLQVGVLHVTPRK